MYSSYSSNYISKIIAFVIIENNTLQLYLYILIINKLKFLIMLFKYSIYGIFYVFGL